MTASRTTTPTAIPTPTPTKAGDVRSSEPLRHGAYICVRAMRDLRPLGAAVRALTDRLGLINEYQPGDDHPRDAIGFLRRVAATPAAIADEQLARADAIVHIASPARAIVDEACSELTRLLACDGDGDSAPRILGGVVRPMTYTGNAMYNFAYAHRVLQQPGASAPHAFLLPMSKTAAWWRKDWMERHTYFLPRYDDGRLVHQGHVLASAAGVPCLMRRTYRHAVEPAPDGAYDFVTYFECADADVATFREVCAALRDEARNPEWQFVREGPLWQGRRVATWEELVA
jgi:hypothetical protein